VPGVNLSRAEATVRANAIAVKDYSVSLDFTTGDQTFLSRSVINFDRISDVTETFLDVVAQSVISAQLNGRDLDLANFDGESFFLTDLQAHNTLDIQVVALYSNTGEGLQRSVDPVDGEVYLYSQGETNYIRKMYPCFDQPSLKAQFTFDVIAPANWIVLSNNPVASKIDVASGTHWKFTQTPRIASYATGIVAGPYAGVTSSYENNGKVIPLGVYCRKSMLPHLDAENIFRLTRQGFGFFEQVFGLAYPFEKYDQVAVVDFNWGAMENIGVVTYREDLLVFRSRVTERMLLNRANVILHEMAHMWFGNMVTMSWWDDLWLNESFAEWTSYLALGEATEFKNNWSAFNVERKGWAYRQDQLSTTHPVVTDMVDINAVNANFDGISYAKGASVLHQLTAYVGRENFIKALQAYFAKHAFKNTTLNDLLVELEAASGRDLTPWVATWLQTAGVNTLRPVVEISDGKYSKVAISQLPPSVPAGSNELRPHRLQIGLFDLIDNRLTFREAIDADLSGASTEIADLAGRKAADLMLVNHGDLSYAKLRIDETSLAVLKEHLGDLVDPLARALCWATVWDMHRDAELSSSDFVATAINGLRQEKDVTTLTTIAGQLATSIELYAHASARAELRGLAADAFRGFIAGAAPGSDLQLQYVRAFAGFATTAADTELLRNLLAGKLEGLTLDADLRWILVKALVERGAMDIAAVDSELAADQTLNGQLNHEMCIASFPNAGAKQRAWDSIVNDDLATAMRRSKLSGLISFHQLDLLEDFVPTYFDLLLKVWNDESYEYSKTIVSGLFPTWRVSSDTVERSDAWLSGAGKDAPATLRRLVIEGRDAVARAVKVAALK
jgi:aminopeptidase N